MVKITLQNATLFFFRYVIGQGSFTNEARWRNLDLYLAILSSFCTMAKFTVVFCVGVVYVAQHTVDIH